jgi:CP family cyanate transporter-like MFS transporter
MSESRLAGRGLVLLGIAVLAFNLRPAAVSVGPVLDEIRAGLGMSGVEAGILTSLPVVAFAVFGAAAPRLARRVGLHRFTLVSLLAVVVGLLGRSQVDDVTAFLVLSLLGLAGMAAANVLLPSLVRLHFPDRVGTITAVYTTALAIGLTAASVLTVPISEEYDGWQTGLAVWAATAAIAVLPWVALVRRDRRTRAEGSDPQPVFALRAVGRTRLGRLMAAFFAFQSLQAYAIFGWFAAIFRDAGFSGTTAGLLLGVITGVSIPLGFVVPALAGRMTNVAPLVIGLFVCYPIGYGGMMLAPSDGAVLWAVLLGVAIGTFPLILVLIPLRARTPEGTAALSGFTQSVGYLAAAVGPFAVGVVHDASGGWTLPLALLLVLALPILPIGLAVSRPTYVEDELRARGS